MLDIDRYPKALEIPFELGNPDASLIDKRAVLVFESGRIEGNAIEGNAKLVFNLHPVPRWEFAFTPAGSRNGSHVLREIVQMHGIYVAQLKFDSRPESFDVSIESQGESIKGTIDKQQGLDQILIRTMTLGVLNGPKSLGSFISRKRNCYAGRLVAEYTNHSVMLDLQSFEGEPSSNVYANTHVARLDFKCPTQKFEWDKAHTALFWTLSLMRGGWVGLVSSWSEYNGELMGFLTPSVTKTSRLRKGRTWYHEQINEGFETLYPLVYQAIFENEHREALLTALHWTVEANGCAGGVEGSIILQQCAMECLAWQQLVECRKSYSRNSFDKKLAVEKLKLLCSEFNIDTKIPSSSTELIAFANEEKCTSVLEILVRVRNSLVHAEPKKVKQLFAQQLS